MNLNTANYEELFEKFDSAIDWGLTWHNSTSVCSIVAEYLEVTRSEADIIFKVWRDLGLVDIKTCSFKALNEVIPDTGFKVVRLQLVKHSHGVK
jgi:hypothetical protein